MENAVVHFEIISSDGAKARDFYGKHFDWAFNTDNPLNYGATDTQSGDGNIRGGVADAFPGSSDVYVTFYISVNDIEKVLNDLLDDGSSIAMPVMKLPGGSKMAQFFDPFGSRIGLLQS
ncbi:MAG: VOC family protein [Pseudomonadota bacterium]